MKKPLAFAFFCILLASPTQAKDKNWQPSGTFRSVAYLLVPGSNTTQLNTSGSAYTTTNCYGMGTNLGYLINLNMNCMSNTTVTPPQSYPITIRYMDVYNLVEKDNHRMILVCRGVWRWTKCMHFIPDNVFAFRDLGGQVEVQMTTTKGKIVYAKYKVVSVTPIDKTPPSIDETPPPPKLQKPNAKTVENKSTTDTSAVSIKSIPEGAEITVDGKYVGNTPSTLQFTSGDHRISLEKSGFKAWQRTISVTPGGLVTVEATLERIPEHLK